MRRRRAARGGQVPFERGRGRAAPPLRRLRGRGDDLGRRHARARSGRKGLHLDQADAAARSPASCGTSTRRFRTPRTGRSSSTGRHWTNADYEPRARGGEDVRDLAVETFGEFASASIQHLVHEMGVRALERVLRDRRHRLPGREPAVGHRRRRATDVERLHRRAAALRRDRASASTDDHPRAATTARPGPPTAATPAGWSPRRSAAARGDAPAPASARDGARGRPRARRDGGRCRRATRGRPRPVIEFELDVRSRSRVAEAEEASKRYAGFEHHAYPTCFTCGPAREDGLGIFAGPVAGRELVAAPWTPAEDVASRDRLGGARLPQRLGRGRLPARRRPPRAHGGA